MKKIILKESQVKKLMGELVTEQIGDDTVYTQEVRCSFNYDDLKFSEEETIDWIDDVKFNVRFTIDMEGKSYGIKHATIGRVWGPEEILVDVTIYVDGEEDPETYRNVTLKPNWYNTIIEYDADIGWIGLDGDVEMDLAVSDYVGSKLAVSKITVHAKGI